MTIPARDRLRVFAPTVHHGITVAQADEGGLGKSI